MIPKSQWDSANSDQKLNLIRDELESIVVTVGEVWSKIRAEIGKSNAGIISEIGNLRDDLKSRNI